METAFVLINIEAGGVPKVVGKLKKLSEVTEVYSIAGEYDVLAKVQFDNLKALGKLIPEKLQKIPGIIHTTTLMAFGPSK